MVHITIQGWQTLLTLKTSDEDNVRYKQSVTELSHVLQMEKDRYDSQPV